MIAKANDNSAIPGTQKSQNGGQKNESTITMAALSGARTNGATLLLLSEAPVVAEQADASAQEISPVPWLIARTKSKEVSIRADA